MDPGMSFKQLADETLTEAWERYPGFMTDLPTTGMEDGSTLFEKLSTGKRESEVYGLKKNSHTFEIDPLTRKIQGMALTQPVTSETYQAE
jgi:hypothetical protein